MGHITVINTQTYGLGFEVEGLTLHQSPSRTNARFEL